MDRDIKENNALTSLKSTPSHKEALIFTIIPKNVIRLKSRKLKEKKENLRRSIIYYRITMEDSLIKINKKASQSTFLSKVIWSVQLKTLSPKVSKIDNSHATVRFRLIVRLDECCFWNWTMYDQSRELFGPSEVHESPRGSTGASILPSR